MQTYAAQSTVDNMTIGEVARKAGLKTSAIRYYEQAGLLPHAYRKSGRRDYDGSIFQFLAVIRIARACGFTIRQIQRLVQGFPNDVSPSERWREMAEMKVAELKRRTTEMESMIEILRQGLACNCRDLSECILVKEE